MRLTATFAGLSTALAVGGCGGDGGSARRPTAPTPTAPAVASPESPTPRFASYEPSAVEPYRNGKRLAGRVAQRMTTYDAGSSARSVAVAAGVPVALLRPVVDPAARSAGQVLYAQLSGVTATSLGAMVVVRQHLETGAGRRRVTRVIDVRLRRGGGAWSLDRVASSGGTPAPRPERLSRGAERVLDHEAIALPDTARWDIHRGRVDDALLRVLADAGDRRPISVSVLRTGHPANVWMTDRRSAHRLGRAADVYAVGARSVIRQRRPGSPAQALARELVAGGAAQVGSPWDLPPGPPRTFTDRVHQDHLHLQQEPG